MLSRYRNILDTTIIHWGSPNCECVFPSQAKNIHSYKLHIFIKSIQDEVRRSIFWLRDVHNIEYFFIRGNFEVQFHFTYITLEKLIKQHLAIWIRMRALDFTPNPALNTLYMYELHTSCAFTRIHKRVILVSLFA